MKRCTNQNSKISQLALLAAWLIALIAMLITLYMSQILNIPVCPLCWYQRTGIYPLAIILGIALYRNDYKIYIYALPLALIAAAFAFYQYLEQMIPGFGPIHFCISNPASFEDCARIDWQVFGFITLPLLSCISSLVIAVLLIVSRKK